MADVTFFFDPLCPWTWRAARWLALVAKERELDVEWRAFSLELLHDDEGEDTPAPLEVSTLSLRLVEALSDAGRSRDAGRFYATLGRRVHEAHQELDLDLVKAAADDADVGDAIAAIDDPRWDDAIRRPMQALAAAGPDVGSPVVTLPEAHAGCTAPSWVPSRSETTRWRSGMR